MYKILRLLLRELSTCLLLRNLNKSYFGGVGFFFARIEFNTLNDDYSYNSDVCLGYTKISGNNFVNICKMNAFTFHERKD